MCCDSWGRKESDMTEQLNCTELKVTQWVKNPPGMQETQVRSLGQEDPLEKGMQSTIYSSILVWRIPCTEESGELPSLGSQVIDTT